MFTRDDTHYFVSNGKKLDDDTKYVSGSIVYAIPRRRGGGRQPAPGYACTTTVFTAYPTCPTNYYYTSLFGCVLNNTANAQSCSEGTYSSTGVIPCTPCAPGTYQSTLGSTSCLLCSSTACASGTYQSAACTSTSDRVCTKCNPCNSTPISKGGIGPVYISSACTSTSDTVCTSCPSGTASTSRQCCQASTSSGCVISGACDGTTGLAPGTVTTTVTTTAGTCASTDATSTSTGCSLACTQCTAGTYSSSGYGYANSIYACSACTTGTTSGAGATSCTCSPGYGFYSVPGMIQGGNCVECPSGSFSSLGGNTPCTPCTQCVTVANGSSTLSGCSGSSGPGTCSYACNYGYKASSVDLRGVPTCVPTTVVGASPIGGIPS